MERQREPWWRFLAKYTLFYLLVWALMEFLKATFPDVVNTVVQALALPALVLVIALFAYKLWNDVAQPPQRR